MALFKKKQTQPQSQQPMDLEEVMRKYDRESNTRIWAGKPKIFINIIFCLFSLLCLYATLIATWEPEFQLSMFMAFIMFIGFLTFPARKGKQKVNHLPWYDIVLLVVSTCSFLYFTFNTDIIHQRVLNDQISLFSDSVIIPIPEMYIGIVGILCLAELCRRCVGLPILVVAAAFVIYALGWGVKGKTFDRRLMKLIKDLFFTAGENSLFGVPIKTCSKYIVAFIIFGSFLERTGIADFFIKAANAMVGRFSGGPAKVAVVASAMEGMVSGSSVANTVGSGAVTIPLMKKTGYKPEFAAAAEASASTGGQIMPPIMGAAAFLMAERIEVSYTSIVVSAILPAVLFFAGVFITVHLEAKREGLRGLTKDEVPRFKEIFKQLYLLLPLIVLVYLVSSGSRSIAYAAAFSIVVILAVSAFNYDSLFLTIGGLFSKRCKESAKANRQGDKPIVVRETPKQIFEALAGGAQNMITVAVACAVAGIVSAIITMTGLGPKLILMVGSVAGDSKIIALFLTMICCIILGMGVPTTANYCIMAATCAPILVEMGIPALAAHFFVFYFGIVADLTPPVALAAYAGSAIAQSNPMKTAVTATKLAIGAFIVPYIFALNPAMLFINTTAWEVVQICITSLIGMFAVSSCLQGWLLHRMAWYQRIVALVGGLMLIYPGWVTDLAGLGLFAVVIVLQLVFKPKACAKQNSLG